MSEPYNGAVPPVPPPTGGQTGSSVPPYTPDSSAQNPYQQSPYQQTPYQQPEYGTSGSTPTKTLSLIGMIGGIVGLAMSIFGGFGFLFSIAGVVLGHLGKRREGLEAKSLWLTALITGYVGIAISLIWLIIYIIAFIAFGAAFGELAQNGTGDYPMGPLNP